MRIHISLPVTNLDQSLAFYGTVLGQPASKVRDDYANFRLDAPPLHLALVLSGASGDSPAARASGSPHHFGVELPDHDQLGAWRARAAEAGLAMRVEDDVTCCYARADKFWVSDPDGHEWEFWVRTADADAMHVPKNKPQAEAEARNQAQAKNQARPACCP